MGNRKTPTVFFNASVVIAGFISPTGGSGKLLRWVKGQRIHGLTSEIVADEVLRHERKLRQPKTSIKKLLQNTFPELLPAPSSEAVRKFRRAVKDFGDAHLLASAQQCEADFLVSLDKKHVLSLKTLLKHGKIVSPKTLIEEVE